MKLTEAMKTTNVRASVGWRWIIRRDDGLWIVCERAPYGRRQTDTVLETNDEDEAVAALLNDE